MNGRFFIFAPLAICGVAFLPPVAREARAAENDAPAVQIKTSDLAGFYRSLKGSPLGALFKNDKVREFAGHYLRPLGINLTGAKNNPAHDALDRLLLSASGPAILVLDKAGAGRGPIGPFAIRLRTPKTAVAFKDVRTLMKSAPPGALDEKESVVEGKKSLTYTVKPAEQGKPQPRFPFEKLTFVESGGALIVTNMEGGQGLRLAAADPETGGPANSVGIELAAGALRTLLKGYGSFLPGCPAKATISAKPSGLSMSVKFVNADPAEKPFVYLGTHPATTPRPAVAGAYLETAARLDLLGVWNTTWDEFKRRAPAEHFAARATLMEIEKNLGMRVGEDLIPALEGSVATFETGAETGTVAVFRVKNEAAVKKAVESLAALGGKPAADASGVFEIRMGGAKESAGAGEGTFHARLAGGFLVVSSAGGPVGGFPASPAISASSGPVSLSADLPKLYAAAHETWQRGSIVVKRRGPPYFPPSLLSGRLGKLTVRSSRSADEFSVDIDLSYAR